MDDDDDINDRQFNEKIAQNIKDFLNKKVNVKNAFETPFLDKFRNDIEVQPLQCVGAMLDASAKIYGYRVDNTHNECYTVLKTTTEEGSKVSKKKNAGDDAGQGANENGKQDETNPDGEEKDDNESEQPGTSKSDENARKVKKNRVNHLHQFEKSERNSGINDKAFKLAKQFTDIATTNFANDKEFSKDDLLRDIADFNEKMQEIIDSRRVGVPFITEKISSLNRDNMEYGIEESLYKKVAKQFAEGCSESFVSNQIETNRDGTFMVLHTNWPNEEPNQSRVKPNNGNFKPSESHELELSHFDLALQRATDEHPSDLPLLQKICEDDEIEAIEEQQKADMAPTTTADEADLEDLSSIGGESRLSVERQVEEIRSHRKELFAELGFSAESLQSQSQNCVIVDIPSKPTNYLMSRFVPLFDSVWHSVPKKITEEELMHLGTVVPGMMNTPLPHRTPMGKNSTLRTPSPAIVRSMPGSGWKAPSSFVTPVLSRMAKPQMCTPAANGNKEEFIYFWARPRQYPTVYPGQLIDESPMSFGEELADEMDGIVLEDIINQKAPKDVGNNGQIDTTENLLNAIVELPGMEAGPEVEQIPTVVDVNFDEPMQLNVANNYGANNNPEGYGVDPIDIGDVAENENANENMDDGIPAEADEVNEEDNLLDETLLPVVELQQPEVEAAVEDNSHWKGNPDGRSDSRGSSMSAAGKKHRKRNAADRNFSTTKRKRPIVTMGQPIENSSDDMFWLPSNMATEKRLSSIRKGQLKTAAERITDETRKHLQHIPDNSTAQNSEEYDPLNLLNARLFQKGRFGFWSYGPSHEEGKVESRFISRPKRLYGKVPTISEQFEEFQRIYFSLIEPPKLHNMDEGFDDPNDHFDVADCDPELANELAAANERCNSPIPGPSGIGVQKPNDTNAKDLSRNANAEDQDDEEFDLIGGAYWWNDPTNGRFNSLMEGEIGDEEEEYKLIGEMIRSRHYLRMPQYLFLRQYLRQELRDYLDFFFSLDANANELTM